MITTIQLNEKVKKQLDKLKKEKESYEDVILNLVKVSDECNRKDKELLIEGYKELAEENLKINKEFDAIDKDFDWQW